MRGSGWNADNSQVSDGRRARIRRCRDCSSTVLHSRNRLCVDCSLRAMERRYAVKRARLSGLPLPPRPVPPSPIDVLSRGLAGLQRFWFTTITGEAA